MTVRSFVPCPLCGKEMRLTSGLFYYTNELGVISMECSECNLQISEYGFIHGLKDAEANSYGKLVEILKRRIEECTKK